MTAPVSGDLPISRDAVRSSVEPVLALQGADAVEVVVAASTTGLTRYALSEIIQNTVRREILADVRVVADGRVASASTNQLSPDRIVQAGERALEAARASLPDPDFPGLPRADDVGPSQSVFRWDDDTAAASPERRAAAVGTMIRATGNGSAAGVFETSAHAYAVVSSEGIDCFDAHTRSVATCLVDFGESTGWGEDSSHALEEVDVEAVAETSRSKAERGRGALEAEPGTYEVVLEPPAVAVLLEYMSYAGFGAKQVIDGDSFLSRRRGETVASPSVTVADDVWHPRSVGIGFDLEGVPKRRVAVIDAGTATGPVTDSKTAASLGIADTGHFSGSAAFGPYAANIVLEPGDRSREALVGGLADGLLVTRFHYVNILDRPATLLTGMTRDGTFRIRGGEVAEAVRNFRFTQSVLDALAAVQGTGRDVDAFAPEFGGFGSTVVPGLHIAEFTFTSRTSH